MAYKNCDSNVAKRVGYWDWLTAWATLPLVQWQTRNQQLSPKGVAKPAISMKTVKTKYRVERRKYEDAITE